MILMHQTHVRFLASIIAQGLRVGHCRIASEQYHMQVIWLSTACLGTASLIGHYGYEGGNLAVLKVDVEGLMVEPVFKAEEMLLVKKEGQYEYICLEDIPPEKIKLLRVL